MKWLYVILLLLPLSSMGSVYLEPYAGYGSGTTDILLKGTFQGTAFDDIDETNSDSGTAFGGKLGFAVPFFAAGLDYMNSEGLVNYGPFLEFRLPLFLKLRATYLTNSTAEEEENGFEFKGTGFKAGLAFSLFANLTLNLDYISTKYDEEKGSVSGFDLQTIDIKQNVIFLSLGFPMEFF